MASYRLIRLLFVAIQLGIFGKLVLLHLNPKSVVATWSWWTIAAPLYAPLLFVMGLLLWAWCLDRLHHILFPRTDLYP